MTAIIQRVKPQPELDEKEFANDGTLQRGEGPEPGTDHRRGVAANPGTRADGALPGPSLKTRTGFA